jgi:pyruvate formate lyase activating enzyme
MTVSEPDGRPLIVDIKRHSLEDGPGIRSVVFFKGCPLKCIFCHSPETQSPGMEIAFSADNCIGSGKCAMVCPEGAIDLELEGRIHRDVCRVCGMCADSCPGKGLRRIGTYYPAERLAEILLRDAAYYRYSAGGVTLSGGECTMYPHYVKDLLSLLKPDGIHITLETSGYFDYGEFRTMILPYVDLVYYDIKIIDPESHRKHTGKGSERILENFRRLVSEHGVEIHPRVPLIPDITATRDNLSAIVELLCDAGAVSVSLLPYNPLGIGMAERLGRPRPPLPERFMMPEEEAEVATMFQDLIAARTGPDLAVNSGP